MTHQFKCRVYYEDTDMAGIVYHANYLRFIERARSEWVRDLGIDQSAMRDAGLVFAVFRIEADFLAPARYGDDLTVVTRPLRATAARMTLRQTVYRADLTLFRTEVTLVSMTLSGAPRRLPDALRATLR